MGRTMLLFTSALLSTLAMGSTIAWAIGYATRTPYACASVGVGACVAGVGMALSHATSDATAIARRRARDDA